MMMTPVTVKWKSSSLCCCLAPLLPTMIELVQFLVFGHLLGACLFVCLFVSRVGQSMNSNIGKFPLEMR